LATRFSATPQTIRKDLNDLCDAQLLPRRHGGASPAQWHSERSLRAAAPDCGRGKAGYRYSGSRSHSQQCLAFIDIGTTTEAVSEALIGHQELMLMNNINVANRLRLLSSIQMVVAGGVVRAADGGIVGEAAVDFERTAPVRISQLSQVQTLITDHCSVDSIRTNWDDNNVALIETAKLGR
jgi:DeoR family transcriptional regulator, glycerol-3-phosphate regulon repressor